MSTIYESIVIFKPSLTDEEVNGYIEKITNLLTSHGAVINKVDLWGKKRLAFIIKKFHEGFYVLIVFSMEKTGATITDLERYYRLTEDIIRSQTVVAPDLRPRGKKKIKKKAKPEGSTAEGATGEKAAEAGESHPPTPSTSKGVFTGNNPEKESQKDIIEGV